MKKFEFLLKINGNIICQRYFSVKNFNTNMVSSYEMLLCVNDCVNMIQEQLKDKSLDFLWEQYNPYEEQTEDQINRNSIWDKEDIFDFEIRIDDRLVGHKRFTGNVYPQRVRYSVDIRDLVPKIIFRIQWVLSQEKSSVEYITTKV